MNNNEWLNAFYLVVILAFVISGVMTRKDMPFAKMAKYFAAWLGIALIVIILYSFRYNFADFKSRVVGELNPAYVQATNSGQIIINKSYDNHFYANVKINDVNVRFMIDTGASDVVLSLDDADRVGIDISKLIFNKPYQTANGTSFGASTIAKKIQFGNLQLRNVRISVNNADMGTSLLGMSFLSKFKKYEFYQDKLILTP